MFVKATIPIFSIIVLFFIINFDLVAQTHTQSIYGHVVDKDSKMPLIGATISIEKEGQTLGSVTDMEGYFYIANVPIGRLDVGISYLGYEPIFLTSIMLTSGKELNLNVEMQESTEKMKEIVVNTTTNREKGAALNEMATVSARSFSVEETARYAGSFHDPARMASNFAGVSIGAGTEDLDNEIVIRGNSPSGMLWRLDGIEIPNPNHFANVGSSGGAISMLSASTLATSDFFTGAFPGEYGNAIAGVFDLNLRNGNNQKHEFSVGLGLLGIETSAEGFFSKKSKASFLINYRYSTLGLVKLMGISPTGEILPNYQDLSFKVNVPFGKAGVFTLWGLGGDNAAVLEAPKDSFLWQNESDAMGFEERGQMGVMGLSHRILLTEKSYLKTVLALSSERTTVEESRLEATQNYDKHYTALDRYHKQSVRLTSAYTHKFSASHTLKIGFVFSHFSFNYNVSRENQGQMTSFLDNSGNTQFLEAYASWKFHPHKNWTFNLGAHYSQLVLNGNYSIEPRFSVKWLVKPKHSLSIAGGMHSRMEDLSYYFLESVSSSGELAMWNKNLQLKKAVHAVLGYEFAITKDLNLKMEAYYQHLYDVPVENDFKSTQSTLNASSIWDLINSQGLVNAGFGQNYGLDITFEKFFNRQYYILFTGSTYDSKFKTKEGNWYNTRFNSNYQITLLGGKEFKVGKKKNNLIGLNGKFILAGGARYTPVNIEASKVSGMAVYEENQEYSLQTKPYIRVDIALSYKINMKKMTHTFELDIQNVIDYQNIYTQYYNPVSEKMDTRYQNGIFPNFNYKIQF